MVKLFKPILFTSIALSFPLLLMAADGNKQVIKTKAPPKTEIVKTADPNSEESLLSSVVASLLSQIIAAPVELNIDVSSSRRIVDGVEKTVPDIKLIEALGAVIFKDDVVVNPIQNGKPPSQVKKVIPVVRITTKNLLVIYSLRLQEKGKMRVRFCQSYTRGNDVCNTADDTKLLEININSPNFEIADLKFKEFNVDFDQQLANGKFSLKGSCLAYASSINYTDLSKPTMKAKDCSFHGTYDANASGDKITAYGFKFVTKTP